MGRGHGTEEKRIRNVKLKISQVQWHGSDKSLFPEEKAYFNPRW